VRLERERVLVGARHAPLLGDLLRGDAHAVGDGDVLVGEDAGAHRHLVAHHWNHAHGLDAASQHQVGLAEADPVRGQRHGLQARGAEAVDGLRRGRFRKARQQRADARDVHALLALGHRAADHDVVDAARVDPRRLPDDGAQDMREEVGGVGVAQRAARCLADRRARRRDDVRILDLLAHLNSSAACRWQACT
jgi:hypothetical protein